MLSQLRCKYCNKLLKPLAFFDALIVYLASGHWAGFCNDDCLVNHAEQILAGAQSQHGVDGELGDRELIS